VTAVDFHEGEQENAVPALNLHDDDRKVLCI
jgi:hypothetical protein